MFKHILAATFLLGLASTTAIAANTKISDPQIAHIAYTAGQIDVTAAEQALKKSKNTDVIEFAKTMERDHKAVNEQALALVKKLKVTPEDNLVSKSLNAQATRNWPNSAPSTDLPSTRPISTMKSPITRRSTARSPIN